MEKNNNLTEKQQKVLEFIYEYVTEKLYSPSVREIGLGVGLKSSSSVFAHLNTLEEKGYITTDQKKARTIKINGYKIIKEKSA